MFKRQALKFIVSALFSISFIALYFTVSEKEGFLAFFPIMLFVSYFALPLMLFYALPVSLISEKWTQSLSERVRISASLLVHLGFGGIFVFLIGPLFEPGLFFQDFSGYWRMHESFFFAAVFSSFSFWLIGEAVRCSERRRVDHKFEHVG